MTISLFQPEDCAEVLNSQRAPDGSACLNFSGGGRYLTRQVNFIFSTDVELQFETAYAPQVSDID